MAAKSPYEIRLWLRTSRFVELPLKLLLEITPLFLSNWRILLGYIQRPHDCYDLLTLIK